MIDTMIKVNTNKTCPLCKDSNLKEGLVINGWHLNYCKQCDVFITDATNKDISDINRSRYDQKYEAEYLKREKQLIKRFLRLLKIIEHYTRGGKLLDIGCGLGLFLKSVRLKSVFKWKLFGVEPNTYISKQARKITKEIIVNGKLPKINYSSRSFDCITCFDVLEHSYDVEKNLTEIKRLLTNDGVFVLQMPNFRSLMSFLTKDLWDWWSPPDHVIHFSFNAIIAILERNSFEIIYKTTYEDSIDFIKNLRPAFKKMLFGKYIYILSIPLMIIVEKITCLIGYGGLSFIVCRVKRP